MPHAHPIAKPSPDDLVTVRFSVPSTMVTAAGSDVFVRTSTGGVIRIPAALVKEGGESGQVIFEAAVPPDVAAAVRSICAGLFRLTCSQTEG
jgi:hypothetical protein